MAENNLEKYLSDKGITIDDIQSKYPDLASLTEKYFSISQAGDDYADELSEIGSEIMEKLSEKDISPKKEDVVAESESSSEEPIELPSELMDLPEENTATTEELAGLEDLPLEIAERKIVGIYFKGAEFTRDGFMKILSFLGIGYRWKEKGKQKFWVIDENNYLVTDENPFAEKTDLYVVTDEASREGITSIVQSKSLSYDEKADLYDAPLLSGTEEGVTSDDKELVTGIPYKLIDETIQDLFRIESMPELVTLMELSTGKKYACGCGHI